MSQLQSRYLHLGAFLDQLLNRECRLRYIGAENEFQHGGIILPEVDPNNPYEATYPGSGNIVIMGDVGTGKTTLALQIAQACCCHRKNENMLAAYISLEESCPRLKAKAMGFGWDHLIQPLIGVQDTSLPPSKAETAGWLKRAILHATEALKGGMKKGKKAWASERPILVPSLSPRRLVTEPDEEPLFWERFKQLERLLEAAQELRKGNENKRADLRVVCLDSLSVFGETILSREQLFRIFDLFSRTQTIGIFVAEDKDSFPMDPDQQHMEAIDNLADVVIQLTNVKEEGYFRRYIEVLKSRYTENVLGRHVVKLSKCNSDMAPEEMLFNKHGFVVYPSIHYLLSSQSPSSTRKQTDPIRSAREPVNEKLVFGTPKLAKVLPANYARDWVVLIEGPRHTFKSALGVNYLLRGLWAEEGACNGQPENVLLVRLHDNPYFSPERPFLGTTRMAKRFYDNWSKERYPTPQWHEDHKKRAAFLNAITQYWAARKDRGGCYNMVPIESIMDVPSEKHAIMSELTLRTGNISPEEAMVHIWEQLHQMDEAGHPVTRVLLDDISRIGISFPALRSSENAGELFLTALAHMLRGRRIGMVMVGTTGEHALCDEIIGRAKNIANTYVSTQIHNIFGNCYTTLTGEGVYSYWSEEVDDRMEYSPVAITTPEGSQDNVSFVVDDQMLVGLGGFNSPDRQIFHPHVHFHIFEEGRLQKKYNDDLELELQWAFDKPKLPQAVSTPATTQYNKSQRMHFFRFGSNLAVQMFQAVRQQYSFGAPQESTIICTLDEFAEQELKERFVEIFPAAQGIKQRATQCYYRNILCLAVYNLQDKHLPPPTGWKGILEFVQDRGYQLYIDQEASETMVCLLLDAIYAAGNTKTRFKTTRDFLEELATFAHSDFEHNEELKAFVRLLTVHTVKKDSFGKAKCPAIGLLWYTQLMEIVNGENKLEPKSITVSSLPGKGFTGDWYLGVLKGSVGIHMGKRIIDLLMQPVEQYRRFMQGVGLPAEEVFYNRQEAFAIEAVGVDPGPDIYNLERLANIHREANSRTDIPQYYLLRTVLYEMANALISCCEQRNAGATSEDLADMLKGILLHGCEHMRLILNMTLSDAE